MALWELPFNLPLDFGSSLSKDQNSWVSALKKAARLGNGPLQASPFDGLYP